MIESIHFQGVDYTPEAFAEFQQVHPEAFLSPAPAMTFAEKKEAKVLALRADRYREETSGVSAGDVTIATDRESQAMITGAALMALQDPTYTCEWQGSNGWTDLTAAEVIGVAQLVRDHVQRCFAKCRALELQVAAAETEEQLEAIAWS